MGEVATTADLMEAIFNTPEPGRTRLVQAWRRLREDDRPTLGEAVLGALVTSKELKRHAAVEAIKKHGTLTAAARALGMERTTLYRWLK